MVLCFGLFLSLFLILVCVYASNIHPWSRLAIRSLTLDTKKEENKFQKKKQFESCSSPTSFVSRGQRGKYIFREEEKGSISRSFFSHLFGVFLRPSKWCHLDCEVGMATTATGPRYVPEGPTLPKPWKGLVDGQIGYLYF